MLATDHRDFSRLASLLLALIMLVSACTAYQDTANVAETVDEAVTLLQDIEQRGSWEVIDDGLDALNGQETGYHARATVETHEQGAATTTLVVTIQADGSGHARVQVSDGETAGDYLVLGYSPDTAAPQVYRLADKGYTCLSGDTIPPILRAGISGLFDAFAIQAAGIQTLSIVDQQDDEPAIAGRMSIHYELESKFDEAVQILDQLENERLQQAVMAAGPFELTGDLYLDEDTLALLKFDSTYIRLEKQVSFDFTITQWGAVPAIPAPTANEIVNDCN